MTGFDSIAAMVKARSGIALGADKAYLVEARLNPILKRQAIPDLTALAVRMRLNATLEQEVVEAMTTNETLFFRDGRPFDHLRDIVLPRLHASRAKGVKLRIWSAAASSGQEAYSLAILVSELAPILGGRVVEIVATDIAQGPLQRGIEGLYSQLEVQRGLPEAYLRKYFTKEAAGWRVKPNLRAMVQFRVRNLLSDLSALGRFDVVFCRNVLIYFDQPTRQRILRVIASNIEDEGALYLGGAETLTGVEGTSLVLDGAAGSYRSRRTR